MLTNLADGVLRGVDAVTDTLTAPFAEPRLRLGVTGLSRAGKTVFITSLIANLMDRGRMPGLVRAGAIETAILQPQPDDTIARFPYENHIAALTGPEPHWPEGTRRVSELRLSLRLRPAGLLAGLSGARVLHLDIVDYPGEWLLDLGLLDKTYAQWSEAVLARLQSRDEARAYLDALSHTEANGRLDEPQAQALAAAFTDYLTAARAKGWSDCTPGRFLLPGDLKGSPVLTFAPLPRPENPARRSLWAEFERRFESYKRLVIKPFFRDHFSRIDRQIVLVDVLGALHSGPWAMEDLRRSMADILTAFRPGRNAFLTQIFQGRRIEKILFAATKADHLHHSQHDRLTALTEALLREARDRADFRGAQTAALSLAALRCTTEEILPHDGADLPVVRGRLLSNGKQAALYPGVLPEDPAQLLVPARAGETQWLNADYDIMNFAPAPLLRKPGEGPPHIRMDRAAQFLIGDRL